MTTLPIYTSWVLDENHDNNPRHKANFKGI